ncbi:MULTISPECIES: oligosaccharide flippase family protein [unclassified Marinobacter]|uniref:oligosaccharide flippase family protein n=1 Tax=unclassified Marinobacter TaxID=83889 RepID=UPI0018F21AD9|nr:MULTISPECIES: oligosaccharide flippase family protein [unclassified Marinobacter]
MTAPLRRLLNSGRGEGLKAQLVRGALGVGGLKLLSLPLTLGTSILLARGLGPEGYGQYVFVLAVISMMALPVGPGLGQLVTREIAKFHHSEEWGLFRGLLRRAHQWVVLGSLVLGVLIAMLSVQNARWVMGDRWTLLLLATLMLPLLGLNALRSATLRGLRNVFYAQVPELIARPGLHLIIAASLLLVGVLNPATALVSQIMSTALAFFIGAWFLSRLKPRPVGLATPAYRQSEWGRSLLPFTLLAAVAILNGQIGILALGWLGTDAEVASLRIAQNGAMLVVVSQAIVNQVIGPHVTRARQNNDESRLKSLSKQSARGALAVALPIALPLIFLGAPIVGFIYGETYQNTVPLPLIILAIGQLVNVAFGSVGLFLTMSGFERDTLAGQVVALAVNAIAAIILIPPFGVVGAAVAITIGLVTWNVVLATRFVKRLGFTPSAF